MSIDEVLVVVAGISAIAWVNWFFFLSERKVARATAGAGGVQVVAVVVEGGYEPAVIHARAGAPLRLEFDRRETSNCSEELVIPEFGVRRFLPAGQTTAIELGTPRPGTYEFTCGMGMLRGKLVVEHEEGA